MPPRGQTRPRRAPLPPAYARPVHPSNRTPRPPAVISGMGQLETNGIAAKIANSILVGTARASKAGHGALAACPSCNSFAAFGCTAIVLPLGCRDRLQLSLRSAPWPARSGRGRPAVRRCWVGRRRYLAQSAARGAFRGDRMQNRYRRLLLVVSVSLWVVVGLAEHALALAPTCIEFNIPTTDSVPTGITSGPDGALWFTEEFKKKIGRITTPGGINEFPYPQPPHHPGG